MKRPGDEWVRVKSADELAAGMTVRIVDCTDCGRTHQEILVRTEAWAWCPRGSHWATIGCGGAGATLMCPGHIISQGRLYRLSDDTHQEADTKERQREREAT